MKVLMILDEHNYEQDMPVYEKYSTRAIIVRDGKIAVQQGAEGEYKLLGGGAEEGENIEDALIREVREESGLVVIPDSLREFGEVIERRRDIFQPDTTYICHSYVYFCDAEKTMVEPQMTASELAKGYHLEWKTPQEIIEGNAPFCSSMRWIYRDSELVKLVEQEMNK